MQPCVAEERKISRDDLSIANRISDIVHRITAVAEESIVSGGGQRIEEDGEVVYVVNCGF